MTAVLAASQDSVASSTPSLTASASTASSSNDSSYNKGVPIGAARRKSSNGSGGSTDVPSSSSSTGTPHDPNLKPSTSILANAHEGQSREKIRAKSSKRSAFKAAFIPVQPGRQMKTNGKPLGRTFERKTPLPQGAKFEGGPVLQHDPRGEEASAGDGLVPPSSTSPSKGGSIDAVSMSGDTDLDSLSQSTGSTTNLSSSPSNSTTDSSMSRSNGDGQEEGDDGEDDVFSEVSSPLHPRSRTNTMSTESSSSGSSTHASIRFAPLPVSGRLKRANSITIGVAARSQLLRSQGPGRNSSQFPAQPIQAPLPHGMSYQDTHKGVAAGSGSPRDAKAGAGGVQRSGSSSSRRSGAGEVGSPSSQSSSVDRMAMAGYYGGSVPDDTVDLGEELSKGLKSAWRKMRGSSGGSGNAQDKAAAAAAVKEGGTGGASKEKDKVTPSTVPATKKQSGFDAPSTTSGAAQTAAAADPGGTPGATSGAAAAPGDHTPRRPSSPAQGLSALSLQDRQQKQAQDSRHGNGSHRDHFPSHEGGTTGSGLPTKSSSGGNTPASHGQWHHQNPFLVDHEDRGGDGAKTPRASQQYSAGSQNAANNPPRRLSTGAFLKNESLREMQERRRKGLLGGEGADEDEDGQGEEEEEGAAAAGKGEQNQAEQEGLASSLLSRFSPWGSGNAPAPASGGSGVVKPAHNPEKEAVEEEDSSEGGRNSDDEDEDGDDEEMREAEQLAEQSAAGASRSRMEKAAAVEKVH